ncbi:clotting factor B-like [Homarus americanus]|uniref:clotting factor B-like n=1 Tax=Homarus americanus TaxID=6706 RepID=UPI001C463540|nr:clotting factor B-like [Homarus americanus]
MTTQTQDHHPERNKTHTKLPRLCVSYVEMLMVTVVMVLVNLQLAATHFSNQGRRHQVHMNSARHGPHLAPMDMMLTGLAHESMALRRQQLPFTLLKPAPMVETMETIDDMVRVMTKEGAQANEDLLMQELLQLADEITTSMMPSTSRTADRVIIPTTLGEVDMIPVTRIDDLTIRPTTRRVEATMTLTTTITPKAPVAASPVMAEAVMESPELSYSSSNHTAKKFLSRVKALLVASGIELILPLDCGRNPLNSTQVLGEPLPWVVALGSREDGRFHYRCTGVIITNFHVLTDADCVASPHINVVQASRSGELPDQRAEENFVVGRRIHPDIEARDDLFTGINIGILELANPFIFSDYLQPVCLPGVFEEQDTEASFAVTIAGFENIMDGPQGRVASRYAKPNVTAEGAASCFFTVRTNTDLSSMLYTLLTKNHLCVYIRFETVGKSVVLVEDEKSGRVRVVGVGGFANARSTIPVAYTLVQPYRFWVELVLKKFLNNMAPPKDVEAGRSDNGRSFS